MRYKFHSIINILGLAIGLACCIFILLYIKDEISFDRFHEKKSDIYRLYVKGKMGTLDLYISETAGPTGPAFVEEIPEIIDASRLSLWTDVKISFDDQLFMEKYVYLVDSSFLSIFSFPLIEGDPETALADPYSLVLTESVAKKYFCEDNSMGKTVNLGNDENIYTVTGVVVDPPHNTHFDFDILCSITSWGRIRTEIWLSHYLNTYVLLEEGTDPEKVEKKIPDILFKYLGPELESYFGIPMDQFEESGYTYGMFLEPLIDIHFNTGMERQLKPAHDKSYIYIFSVIALFILIIAVINFMNLATARSQTRSKEVAIRKVAGSSRSLLIRQFLFESVLLTLISLTLAILLVELLLNPFNNMIQLNLTSNYLEQWYYIPLILVFAILIGILAGSYPSFFLSSFNPVMIISGILKARISKISFRNVLVVIQFLISIFIIIGTIFIYKQIRYLQNKDLGFNKEQILILPNGSDLSGKMGVFKEEVLKLPGVLFATRSTSVPSFPSNTSGYQIEGDPNMDTHLLETNYCDYDFIRTYDMEIDDGRFFSEKFSSDSLSMLVNQAAIEAFEIDDPLSTRIISPEIPGLKEIERFQVIGVVKDFHFESLHNKIRPYTFLLWPEIQDWGFISLRLKPDNILNTVNDVEKIWKEFTNGDMAYFFLDDEFNSRYQEEVRTGRMFLIFTLLAIFIAALGLFGLSAFTVEQRTKEIGIRKTMGSTGINVVGLLSRQIIILVSLSGIVAIPAAFYFMRNWLTDFAYKINLSWYIFLLAYIAAVVIAILTTLYQSLIAARRNPAESLRYE